jgi:hypothetical protein
VAEFLDARSVFFDESHDVLQLMDVTRPDEHNIQGRTRLWFFLRGHRLAPQPPGVPTPVQ